MCRHLRNNNAIRQRGVLSAFEGLTTVSSLQRRGKKIQAATRWCNGHPGNTDKPAWQRHRHQRPAWPRLIEVDENHRILPVSNIRRRRCDRLTEPGIVPPLNV